MTAKVCNVGKRESCPKFLGFFLFELRAVKNPPSNASLLPLCDFEDGIAFLHQRKPRKTLVMPRFLQFLLAASALSLASASDIAAARPHLMALRGGATTSDLSMPQQAVAMMAASVGVTQQIRATGFLPPPEPVAPHEPAVAVVKLVTSVVVKIFEDLLIHFGLAEKRTQASHRTQAAIVIGFLGLSKVFPGKRLQTKDPDRFLEYLPDRKAYLASYSA